MGKFKDAREAGEIDGLRIALAIVKKHANLENACHDLAGELARAEIKWNNSRPVTDRK